MSDNWTPYTQWPINVGWNGTHVRLYESRASHQKWYDGEAQRLFGVSGEEFDRKQKAGDYHGYPKLRDSVRYMIFSRLRGY